MKTNETQFTRLQHHQVAACILASMLVVGMTLNAPCAGAETGLNLLQNPGFEEPADTLGNLPHWNMMAGGSGKLLVTDQAPHGGRWALIIPAHTAVEQRVESVKAGAYVARAWVKSEAAQTISLLVQDTIQPWAGYTCAELKVPADQWVQIEAFCSLEKDGSLTFTLGEPSGDFRSYHGVGAQTKASITVDDFELFRSVPVTGPLTVWEVKRGSVDWSKRSKWSQVETLTNSSAKACVIQSRQVAGVVNPKDGSLEISSILNGQLTPRCTLIPSIPIPNAKCSLVTESNRKGLRVASKSGDHSYTAWFTPEGLVRITADHIPQFQMNNCHLRYGLLPSFVGTDILYSPTNMQGGNQFQIPSTQWLVGLVDGNDAMLVAVWESDRQTVSLGLAGRGENRLIDSLTIATANAGFSLSLVEHTDIWHREVLQEDWLAAYTPIQWKRPFPARWMCQFFVRPATKPTFRQPNLYYSFPIASAKTRHWGVWFEDTNFYPFWFDGLQTILHFDKTFVPNGDALIYFLEPAASDLYSPCEIVQQALGPEKALALFNFDAYRLRKLNYSTPDEFMYDRPVCATTTRLTKIKQEEKATVGVNLATHLYEFIREIRGRLDQYGAFFTQMNDYLETEKKAQPGPTDYLDELEKMVTDAQSRSKTIYATPLTAVQEKSENIKKLLVEGTNDGFSFGTLDCRPTAGSQDDLCRHYNRFVMQLVQTAASTCGDSPQKAAIAGHSSAPNALGVAADFVFPRAVNQIVYLPVNFALKPTF
jgi:hypothetical protein